jgi:poly-gamma-glutamate capsule biosynthesis protein CapA/YwtB (metallophosphatase superfamily)
MRLALLGDVMLGRLVNEALRALPPAYPWGDTLPILRAADAVIANLECVLADHGVPQPEKVFTFRSDTKNVAVLNAARVAAVSLANNHSLDYGCEALVECLSVLHGCGIAVAGAGRSLDEAAAPVLVSLRGRASPVADVPALALVGWTDNEPAWEAGPHTPGVFYVSLTPDGDDPREEALLSVVAAAANAGQCVIVSAHWGPNWGVEPLADHVRVARRLIDAGADVIFGHSPHVFRGVELYRGKPIFYGCGDFIDDYYVDAVERNDLSCVSVLDYEEGRLRRLLLYPTVIRRFQARLARGADREMFLERAARVCRACGTRTHLVPEGLEIPPDIQRSPDGAGTRGALAY